MVLTHFFQSLPSNYFAEILIEIFKQQKVTVMCTDKVQKKVMFFIHFLTQNIPFQFFLSAGAAGNHEDAVQAVHQGHHEHKTEQEP